jgi:hypothetical protein
MTDAEYQMEGLEGFNSNDYEPYENLKYQGFSAVGRNRSLGNGCHSRAGGNPEYDSKWIPAYAGMTVLFFRLQKTVP